MQIFIPLIIPSSFKREHERFPLFVPKHYCVPGRTFPWRPTLMLTVQRSFITAFILEEDDLKALRERLWNNVGRSETCYLYGGFKF